MKARTAVIAAVATIGLVMSTGTAHAVFTDEVLLTAAEAQAAMAYPSALTQDNMPVSTPGVLMRTFKSAGAPPDVFLVLVSDPQGSSATQDDPKAEAEKAQNQAKNTYPGLECKVYEQSGDKITIVCWGKDPAMVLAFSADTKKYYKKKIKGKMKNVLFKSIPVLGTVTRFLMAPDSEDDSAMVQVTEADRVRAANEAKGLRNAQVAKLPATYK